MSVEQQIYGAHLPESVDLLRLAKQLNLNVVGVSFHVGSGASPGAYVAALENARIVFTKGLELGLPMKVLDIGGGFPGTDQEEISLPQISKLMRPYLDRDWRGVELISEPGRFFCAEAQTLATQVIGKRVRPMGGRGRGEIAAPRREYYVNDGVYQSFNCMFYDHSVLLQERADDDTFGAELSGVPQRLEKKEKFNSAIFGQTCDGLDTIAKDILLPELRVGDWLVVPSMGAYTNGASSQFNGFALNGTVVLNSQREQGIDV